MKHSFRPVTGVAALRRANRGVLAALTLACLALFSGVVMAQGPDPDRYIVQFKERGNGHAARQAIGQAGGQVLLELPNVNAVAARVPAQALQGLRNNPNIALIEQDSPRFPMAQTTPFGISMVGADLVADQSGSSGVKICVIDSGYDGLHEDLRNTNIGGANDGGTRWDRDTCGHGTHVAGTIMAQDNAIGVVGVAPSVGLHIIKVFDGAECGWSYSSNLVNAAYACEAAGAKIINMSLGCIDSGRGGPWACANSTENAAFEDLYSRGMLSISSAGNDGTTARGYPASYASVVSVAAVDDNKVVADFSQRNSDVELAAPGVGVLSTVPTGMGANVSVSVDSRSYAAEAMDGSAAGSATDRPVVNCGRGTSTCNGAAGAICLIERGDVSFADKVLNCQSGGGLAAIIYNNEPGMLYGTLGGVATSIPSVGISQADGQFIAGLGSVTGSVVVGVGNYARYSGTSMASPHVAGVAALVWGQFPSLSNAEVRAALQQSAEDLGPGGRDSAYGYGLVRADRAIALLGGGGGEDPPPPNNPPTASFTYGCTELSCSFNGSGSSDSDGSIVSYSWSFGDGTVGSGVTTSHTYSADGTYTVTLTVTDDHGATDSTNQSISVAAAPGPDPDPSDITLSASGYKVRGVQHVDLSWSGATSNSVEVLRNGSVIATTDNDGAYTDNTRQRGGGSYTYMICETGTSVCSGQATVTF